MTLEKIVLNFDGVRLYMNVVPPEPGSIFCLVPIRNNDGEKYYARFDYQKGIFIDDIFGKNYDTSGFPGKTRDDVDNLRLEASETYGLVFDRATPSKIIDIKEFKYLK